MNVVVTIQHAGHVHFFKHAIAELEARGHEVHVFARENESSTALLERCGIEYELLAGRSDSLPSLAAAQCTYEVRLFHRVRQLDPDVMTAIGGVAVSHVAALLDTRSVVFYDTEHASLICRLAFPFADTVCTPDCYGRDIGEKQVSYPGYHELAYLHPDRFSPDPSVIDDLELDRSAPIVVVRLGDWGSSHDVGASGLDDPQELVETLDAAGAQVLLSSETAAPDDLDATTFSLAPDRLHDLLYYADLYVGEGATTAAECAVLGTPAVYVSSLSLGYLDELESDFGLVVNCTGPDRHERALAATEDLLGRAGDSEWHARRDRLLEHKVDTTAVIVDQLVDEQTQRATTDPPLVTTARR